MRVLQAGTFAWLVAAFAAAPFPFASDALAQNFDELAGQKGCDSVMESHRSECTSLSAKKDGACDKQGSCDLDRQVAQIEEYKAAVERLNSGAINDADRDSFKDSIEKMKAELDARKSDAEANERAARECADARQAVFDFFDNHVIPDTQRAADDAMEARKKLLEDLDKAEVLQKAAKDRRDELASPDPTNPEKDKERYDEYVKMKDEYEKNDAAYRDAEAKLTEFNAAHGNDIDSRVQRLLEYYRSEQGGHKTAIEEQKSRSEKCGKLEYLSY